MEPNLVEKLGFLFYAVSPNRTTFEKVEDVPNYIVECMPWFTFFVLAEKFLISRKNKPFPVNDMFGSASQGIMTEISRILLDGWKFSAYIYIYTNWRIVTLPWDSLWTWFIAFIVADFLYYWTHRASHEINFIWAAHQVHHSSEDYTLTTALRQSVLLSQILWIFYLPVALIVPPAAFLVHFQLTFVYQFWIHTEVIKTIGPFEYVLNTASHHRVHHGRNRYCIDKNYGGVLIIWDRIFGTFEAEKEGEIAYGLVDNINTFESLQIQYGYTLSLLKRVWSTEGWRNKLSLLFKGPGWSPGKPRLGNIEDVPEVKFPVKKYDPAVPFLYNLQGVFHFFAIQITYIALQKNQHILPPKVLYGVIMYIMFSLTSIGSVMDRRPYAVWLELLRCLLYIPVDYYFTPWIFVSNPAYYKTIAMLIRGLFIATGILWLKTAIDGRTVKWNPKKLR